jgi:hypothetical protein
VNTIVQKNICTSSTFMKKFSRNFRLPEAVVELLDQCGEESRTDMVINGILLMSEIDWDTIKKKAKKLGVTPGRLLDVALHRFNDLPTDEQYDALIDYYKIIRENPPKGEK